MVARAALRRDLEAFLNNERGAVERGWQPRPPRAMTCMKYISPMRPAIRAIRMGAGGGGVVVGENNVGKSGVFFVFFLRSLSRL